MSNILELIKQNAVPSSVMRTAAKGALSVPAREMLEILVFLTHNSVFGHDARMTLASWDQDSAAPILADGTTSPEVLGYFWSEANRRPSLMPALIENPAISESLLIELAGTAPRQILSMMLASPRVRSSPAVIDALAENFHITPSEIEELKGASPAAAQPTDPESQAAHEAWEKEHATEIAAEEGKPFELTGKEEEETSSEAESSPAVPELSPNDEVLTEADTEPALEELSVTSETPPNAPEAHKEDVPSGSISSLAAAAMAASEKPRPHAEIDPRKVSLLQKLARMTAAERVKCAFTGNKEERSILIRDGARIVQNAVLASPKLTDPEVETFAASKNLSENVMREIIRNRRFMKNYHVVRNLVNNPKCPLDIALSLVKNLLVFDLKALRGNKNVPEVIRQVAHKLYREKTGPAREIRRR